MSTRTLRRLVAAALLSAACQKPIEQIEIPVAPITVKEATRSAPATATLEPLGNPDGFQPVTYDKSISVDAKAGVPSVIDLGVPASSQSAIIAVRGNAAAQLTSGLVKLTVEADAAKSGQSTWAHVPLKAGKLELIAETDVTLTVRAAGVFEQSGAGLTVVSEPVQELQLVRGETKLPLTAKVGEALDDTWSTWLRVTASGSSLDLRVELRGCGNSDALDVLKVPANGAASAQVLAPKGGLCVYASEAAKLSVQPLARYRRFTKTSTRLIEPVTVLDTASGLGWSGQPVAGQKLEVDLSKLTGLEGAAAVMLKVPGAGVSAGACDGALAPVTGGRVLHDLGKPLCLSVSEAGPVRAELVSLVTAGDAVPLSCPALPAAAACAATDILGQLNCVPGVRATKMAISQMNPNGDQYLVQVTQPIDHTKPDGATFEQRVLLTYLGPSTPVVLHTTGYNLFTYRSDLGRHLNATELEVEHRFFGTSTPAGRDFTLLDIVQSAHDSHRIVELLRPVLKGKWLSTGHSKGGMTAVYHRRFFPCDVDASVPYVTPLSYSLDDPRYGPWLQNLGGPAYESCRQVFRDIDHGIIAGKAQFAPALRGTYSKVGSKEAALWEMTGMMSWGLFQYYSPDDPDRGCPAYEAAAADPGGFAQLVEYYASGAEAYSDQGLAQAENDELFGYTYQTTNELGGQGASRDHLADLGPAPALPPMGPLSLGSVAVPDYEPRSMQDVQDWVAAHGTRFLFIYGSMDPWTGGALEVGQAVDSQKMVAPGANHGAGLEDLAQADRLAADDMLQRWTGSNMPKPSQRLRSSLDVRPQFRDVMARFKL